MLRLGAVRQGVCLRCQYRAAFLAEARSGARHSFVTSRRSRDDVDGSRELITYHGGRGLNSESRAHKSRAQFAAGSMRRKQGPAAREKKLPLNLNKIALEVSNLGAPASILRFDVSKVEAPTFHGSHTAPVEPSERTPPEQEEKDQQESEVTSDEILRTLEDGIPLIAEDEIFDSVEAVKDEWLAGMNPQAVPTATQCHDVYERLDRSFSVPQLQQYLEQSGTGNAEDYADLQGYFEGEHCARSAWYPGKDAHEPGHLLIPWRRQRSLFADLERPPSASKSKKDFGKQTKKVQTIEDIFRQSWRLRSAEELEGPGDMDVSLMPSHRLLLERYNLFQKLEQSLDVRITFNAPKTVLRISGLHGNCAQAFIGLYAPIQTVSHQRLDLGAAVEGNRTWKALNAHGSHFLDTLAESAKAVMEPNPNEHGKVFDVWFLAPQKPDGSGADNSAFEYVSQGIQKILSDETIYQRLFTPAQGSSRDVLVPLTLQSVLPLPYRSLSWIRHESETKESEKLALNQVDTATQERVQTTLSVATAILKPLQGFEENVIPRMPLNIYWQREPKRKVTLATGYLMFQAPYEAKEKKSSHSGLVRKLAKTGYLNSAGMKRLSHELRTFAPAVPGGVNALTTLADYAPTAEQIVIFRLKPDRVLPGQHDSALEASMLPDLELRIVPNAEGSGFVLTAASLSLDHGSQQVMLPGEKADVLLCTRTTLSNTDKFPDQLQDWVSNVIAVDGNVDERAIPRTLEMDVPWQATAARPNFCKEATDSIAKHREQHIPKLNTRPPAPDDFTLKRATASDLIIGDEEGGECFEILQRNNPDGASEEQNSQLDRELEGWSRKTKSNYGYEAPIESPFRQSFDEPTESGEPDDPNDPFTRDIRYRGVPNQSHSVKATYRFVGTEYHDRLITTYKGCKLLYNMVDAGDIEGRHDKLVLEAPDLTKDSEQALDQLPPDTSTMRRIRDRLIRKDRELLRLDSEEFHRLADWLEKGLEMVEKLRSM